MKYALHLSFSLALLLLIACGGDSVPQTSDAQVSTDQGRTDAELDGQIAADAGLPEDDSGMGPNTGPCDPPQWALGNSTIEISCGTSSLSLTPMVHAGGSWQNPNRCESIGSATLRCQFGEYGELAVTIEPPLVRTEYTANTDHEFGGHGLKGIAVMPDADAWLSNGFQSWSQSGVIAIPEQVSDIEVESQLRATGDIEVIRNGIANSWWHTFVRGRDGLVAGATTAETFRSWATVTGRAPNLSVRFASGGAGEALMLRSGRRLAGENWYLTLTKRINDGLSAYGEALPTRAASAGRPEAGWNSWYELWDTVDEEAVRANAALAGENLTQRVPAELLPLRIVIDDGWQQEWGDWTGNEKFPSGMQQLATDLKNEGFNTGIWLAPLLVKANLPLVTERPDWFVQGTSYTHLRHGEMKILDVTHPGAAEHLTTVIQDVVAMGYDLLKIDFLFAGTFEGERLQRVTGMQAYNRALQIIRDAAGPETIILSVGSPPIASFDVLDVWRLGPDVAVQVFDATWFFVPGVARTTASRWPYCRAILCDGDPPLLRNLPQNEINVAGWAAAFAGSALFLSDDLRNISPERWAWLTPDIVSTALTGEPAIPDPVPLVVPFDLKTALSDQSAQENRHEVPSRWSLTNGDTVYVNWSDAAQEIDGERVSPRTAVRVSP